MSNDPTKSSVRPADNADPEMEAMLEELRQAQAEMDRLSKRVVKLLGRPR